MTPITMVTEREKLHLQDALIAESLKTKKYDLYASSSEDGDLRDLFARMSKESGEHKQKIEELMRHTGLSIQAH